MNKPRSSFMNAWRFFSVLLVAFLISTNSVGAAPATTSACKPGTTPNEAWKAIPTSIPAARFSHSAIWTGSELIIWGGGANFFKPFGDGARYNPTNHHWTMLPSKGAPTGRINHFAFWTGSEMIIWGGYDGQTWRNDGARYNPSTDSWNQISTIGVSQEWSLYSAVWTGSEMIIWGGNDGNQVTNNGARYNPMTDRWSPVSMSGAPTARYGHSAVWTGEEMIIWGGQHKFAFYETYGARYDPNTDGWTPIAIANAPSARSSHSAVWTGKEMIIWGGEYQDFDMLKSFHDGALYNPLTDSWKQLPTSGAPPVLDSASILWDGTEMIIWGGYNYDYGGYRNSGVSYNPVSDLWSELPTDSAPAGRRGHTAIWTGSQMIV